MDVIPYETGAYYIFDRGYVDFERLFRIQTLSAFFIVRAKANLKFNRMYSNKVDIQLVKTAHTCSQDFGYDAGKRIKGRKRYIVTDTLGCLLLVSVHGVGGQDRNGIKRVLPVLKTKFLGSNELPRCRAAGYQMEFVLQTYLFPPQGAESLTS